MINESAIPILIYIRGLKFGAVERSEIAKLVCSDKREATSWESSNEVTISILLTIECFLLATADVCPIR